MGWKAPSRTTERVAVLILATMFGFSMVFWHWKENSPIEALLCKRAQIFNSLKGEAQNDVTGVSVEESPVGKAGNGRTTEDVVETVEEKETVANTVTYSRRLFPHRNVKNPSEGIASPAVSRPHAGNGFKVAKEKSGLKKKAQQLTRELEKGVKGWNLHEKSFRESGANGKCLILKEQHLYYPESEWAASDALLAALRRYEQLHKRCVTGVSNWDYHFEQLQPGYEGCKYIIYEEVTAGLGNRFGSLLGAFSYGLLTDRALLVQHNNHLSELLCNPFPESSWWLPEEFPLSKLNTAPQQGPYFYDNATSLEDQPIDLKRRDIVSITLPWWAERGPNAEFFCSSMQEGLLNVTWAYYRETNLNIGPPLWLIHTWHDRLHKLFPDRRMITPMARYLLLPINAVWQKVTQSYNAYLRHSSKVVGVQIRTMRDYNPVISKRVLECLRLQKILKEESKDEEEGLGGTDRQLILVTSMSYGYYQDIKQFYNSPAGHMYKLVAVHTESTEHQEDHAVKANHHALTEMWLLSLSDTLLISVGSSFGIIPDALAGREDVYKLSVCENGSDQDWKKRDELGMGVCEKSWSAEGCHLDHTNLLLNCTNDPLTTSFNTTIASKWFPFVRTCQDGNGQKGIGLVPAYSPHALNANAMFSNF